MREFKTLCIDDKTGCQMILSECSYNFACDYLMRKGFTEYDKFYTCGSEVTMEFTKPTKRTFIYDENRGYLLAV